jgi:adenosylhomocysteine nucleosidase
MRAILYAMQKEVSAPFTGGEPLENSAGITVHKLSDNLLVCVCGIGKVNTALAAQLLIDRFNITELWNAGVTGCFHDYPAGTLLCAQACVQHDMETFGDPPGLIPVVDLVHLPCADAAVHAETLRAAGYDCKVGVVASGDWFGRDFPRAERIRDHFTADVCDMEAGAAAHVCLRNRVPFHCLKVVSDHLFHPSQYEEYQANLPGAVQHLNEALAILIKE